MTTFEVSEDIGEVNSHRLITPGHQGWDRTAAPDDPNKYFMVNTDSHANEPVNIYPGRLPEKYLDRVPHVKIDDEGNHWLVVDSRRPVLVRSGKSVGSSFAKDEWEELTYDSFTAWTSRMEPDDAHRMSVSSNRNPDLPGIPNRLRDAKLDGVEGEIIFGNRGLLSFATPDGKFAAEMTKAWNRWAWETYEATNDYHAPMAMIAPHEVDEAVKEVYRAAGQGFKGFNLPCRPVYGDTQDRKLQYNQDRYLPLWAAIEETGLPVTFHVASGRDPRAASGHGGAIFNLVMGSYIQVVEPLAYLLAAGTFERFPALKAGTIEGGIGWVPWLLEVLDDAWYKHHMWVSPLLKELPSAYYRRNCFSTFMEDHTGLLLVEQLGFEDNFMWSSDYPHHEGTWPHSQQAIERQMGGLSESTRAKILGLNAARIFGFEVPARQQLA